MSEEPNIDLNYQMEVEEHESQRAILACLREIMECVRDIRECLKRRY